MMKCPACSSEISGDSRFCSSCGEAVETPPDQPTVTSPPTGRSPRAPDPSIYASAVSIDEARFAPGTMLADRYRIVGLLGKGGMGEVYRADDLTLRQPVALKFLPEALAKDARRLERFHHEVRVARQVSHPNVCRVYDIGEVDGQPFLSMEFVDGEDLASVLRRMGRPSHDKAVEIARQLCAGLAAAHDNGVLHRDLKPHNIMIDGSGRVRVTDFGLAGFVGEFTGGEIRAGTPAYMAPEQLAGKGVSVKSDIYSLGLVLFELFTGQRANRGKTPEEILRSGSAITPTSMSSIAADVDPAVERVIVRCLEREPSARPSSALAVAAALPGGDPLAAALAAGEIPSPQMIADAGDIGGLRPAVSVSCLVAAIVGLSVAIVVQSSNALYRRVPLELSSQDLSLKARDILTELDYTDHPPHRAFGFERNRAYLKHVTDNVKTTNRWDDLASSRPPAVFFWYRHSTKYLRPKGIHAPRVGRTDPPQVHPGSATIWLDPNGRLVRLEVSPAEKLGDKPIGSEVDWAIVLASAGLEIGEFAECDPVKAPQVPCAVVKAWRETAPPDGQESITVQAGAVGGRLTYFDVIGEWNAAKEEEDTAQVRPQRVVGLLVGALFLGVLAGAFVLARRNILQGRSDRKGAFRLLVCIVAVYLVSWCLIVVQVQTVKFNELAQDLTNGQPLGHALLHACVTWLLYIALEPYVRRLWPGTLVSWTRVLAGRFRDPLIGRDILVGALFAVAFQLLLAVPRASSSWLDLPPAAPSSGVLESGTLTGVRNTIGMLIGILPGAVGFAMVLMVLVLVLRVLLRRTWAAVATAIAIPVVVVIVAGFGLEDPNPMQIACNSIIAASAAVTALIVLLRFGLFATAVMMMVSRIIAAFPVTFDLSTWYAGPSLFALGVLAVLLVYGFYISLAGRALFKDVLLET